jgi:phosphatidate cytidylyltransferase
MLKRTITALVIIATAVAAMVLAYFYSHIILDVYILLWAALGVYEMYHSFKASGYNMHIPPLVFGTIAVYPVYYLMQHYLGSGLIGIVLVFLFSVGIELVCFTFSNQTVYRVKDLGATVFVLIYPLLFVSMAWVITYNYSPLYSMLLVIFLPVATDTFAYFTGSLIKGKKLCPSISPKKTVAGAVGGLFGGMILAILFFLIFDYFSLLPELGYVPFVAHSVDGWEWKTALIYLAIGFFGAVVSELGDLAASRIKRDLGIKDYGKIFPGHGGVMDRLDSIMSGILVVLTAFTFIYL